jgi:hypothetical protein
MGFALHMFKHYLLGNKFVFYVDHMVLVYLVNKPQVSRRLTRWWLLFLEYDFIVVYKPSRTHVIVDALSWLPDITKPTSVPKIDASLFYTKPKWLNDVKEFLRLGQIGNTSYIHYKQRLIKKAKPFTLKNGEVYTYWANTTNYEDVWKLQTNKWWGDNYMRDHQEGIFQLK